jgi:hypothetical protein
MSENGLKEGKYGASPDKVLKDYENSKRIREEHDAGDRAAKQAAKEVRLTVLEAERLNVSRVKAPRKLKIGPARYVTLKIPVKVMAEIEAFCREYGLTRSTWFTWAVATQHLLYKKMSKDAEAKEKL